MGVADAIVQDWLMHAAAILRFLRFDGRCRVIGLIFWNRLENETKKNVMDKRSRPGNGSDHSLEKVNLGR